MEQATRLKPWFLRTFIVLGVLWVFQGLAQGGQQIARPIGWEDLRPANQGSTNTIFPGIATSEEQGRTLSLHLEDEQVRIEGYVLPIDRNEDNVYEFFLVPWLGACSHAPQPPPNQMVHVIPKTPLKIGRAYEFVSVSGSLHPEIEKTQLFIMDGRTVLTSGYSIGRAETRLAKSSHSPAIAGSPLGISAN
ncbi:MAG: DUF3299 domain-containing protein [Mesorhizobium sp.]